MKKLTIGSAVYDDFEGVYFTYQSLRLNNQDILDDLEFIIIDNNPDSEEGKAVKHFCAQSSIRYVPHAEKVSTAIRNEIFKNAEAPFAMSIDPHVLFEGATIKKLIAFFEDNKDSKDLYHGPMLYDTIINHDPVTHMKPQWRDHMFGTWECGKLKDDDPFEIPMHGLGIFACKTAAWLGFNDKFSGFGGEEGYIHEKFKQAGQKIWCLPFLKWVHRFQRPRGVQYPLNLNDRIRNYFIGFLELGKDVQEIIDHFGDEAPDVDCEQLLREVREGKSVPLVVAPSKAKDKPIRKTAKVSSIKFNEPLAVKYLKIEFFADSTLGAIKVLPSSLKGKEFKASILSQSDSGIKNPESLYGKSELPCVVSGVEDFKEITLEYDGVMHPSCINVHHDDNTHIVLSVSEDGGQWTPISEIS